MELVGEIAGHLPKSDQLKCLLVSKYWRESCLHQTCRALRVDSDTVEEWMNVPVDRDKAIRKPWRDYARSLSCTIGFEATKTTYRHYRRFFDQLNGFKQLTSLCLASVRLDSRIIIPRVPVNVEVLTLGNSYVNFGAFAALVECLPKLICQKLGLTQLAVRLQARADVKSMTYHHSRHRAPSPAQLISEQQAIGY